MSASVSATALRTPSIAHSTTANENDGVFLQVMAFPGNISRDLLPVGQANTSHLPESRIRLLRRDCFDKQTDTAFLRATLQDRRLCPYGLVFAWFTN